MPRHRNEPAPLQEDHQREQYFFDWSTLQRLSALVMRFERPLLLCCPMLGRHLWREHGQKVAVLDIDRRFSDLPGFVFWDLYRPQPLSWVPDLVVVDPPFHSVRLDQLFLALRTLGQGELALPLLVTTLPERADALVGTLHAAGLKPTGFRPTYASAPDELGIEFYSNLDEEALAPLR